MNPEANEFCIVFASKKAVSRRDVPPEDAENIMDFGLKGMRAVRQAGQLCLFIQYLA